MADLNKLINPGVSPLYYIIIAHIFLLVEEVGEDFCEGHHQVCDGETLENTGDANKTNGSV